MGNPLATMMLLLWPGVAAVLFARMDRTRAFLWTIIGAYMFLPNVVTIDLPAVPAIGKKEIAAMAAIVMVWLTEKKAAADRGWVPPLPLPVMVKGLIILSLLAGALTVVTNFDPLIEGVSYRPGMTAIDIVSSAMQIGAEITPFVLAYRLLFDPRGARLLLTTLALAVVIYSPLMMFEVRMSPQLNVMFYGFFQHDFVQTIRMGGFRPIVFMEHPIWVASFVMAGTLGSVILARAYPPHLRRIGLSLYLLVMLLMCKTVTALALSALALPLLIFAPPRIIILVAVFIGMASFLYPIFRIQGLIPVEALVQFIEGFSEERAASLKFRFDNELILMERALERPLFGWGGWGRNFPINPADGRLAATADGAWVIVLGVRGALGFIAQYALLISPIIAIWMSRRMVSGRLDRPSALVVACLAMLLALNMVELIPNATLTPITWLIAGSLLGNAVRLLSPDDIYQEQLPGRRKSSNLRQLRPIL